MTIREPFELDLAAALSALQDVGGTIDDIAAGFKTSLIDALSVVSGAAGDVDLSVSTESVAPALEEALAAADSTIPVDVDASNLADEVQLALFDADGTISVDADTSTVGEAVQLALFDADTAVVIEADTTAMVSEIETAAQDSNPTVTPSVDAAPATDALGSIDSAAKKAGSSLGTAGGLAGSSATSIGALSGAAGGLVSSVPVLGAVAAGFGTVAAFADKAFDSAVGVQAGILRADQTFGQFRSTIENIRVGSLSISLGDLSAQLGSSTTQTRQAAATFGQLGLAAGIPAEKVALTTAQLEALSARAVALNPSLGSVGDVMESIGPKLARGGRFAAALGISLTTSEISARASADAGGKAADSLTIYEKSAAAAALATEKYGDRLQTDIAQGAQNPIIQQRALQVQINKTISEVGKDLVAPMFELFREAQPDIQAIIKVLGQMAVSSLPAIVSGFKGATPGIVGFLKAVTPLINAAGLLAGELAKIPTPLTLITQLLGQDSTAKATTQLQGYGAAATQAGTGAQQLADGQTAAGESTGGVTAAYDKLQSSFFGVVDAQESYQNSLTSVGQAQQAAEQAAAAVTEAQRSQTQAVRDVGAAQRSVEAAQRGITDAQRGYQSALQNVVDAERQRTTSLRTVAEAQLAVVEAQRELTAAQQGPSERDSLSVDESKLALQRAIQTQTKNAADASVDQLSKDENALAVRRAQLALTDAQTAAAGRVGTAQTGLANAQQRLTDAQLGAERAGRGVQDAQLAVAASAQRIQDAQQSAVDSGIRLEDAHHRVEASSVAVARAQQDAVSKHQAVDKAQQDAGRSAVALTDAQKAFAQAEATEGPAGASAFVQRLRDISAAHPEAAGAIDQLIGQFTTLKDTTTPAQGAAAGDNFVGGMAGAVGAGGPQVNTAAQTAIGGVDFAGLATQFTTGLGIVGPAIAETASTFKDNALGWIDTALTEGPAKLAGLTGLFAGSMARAGLDLLQIAAGFPDNVTGWIGTAITEAPSKLFALAQTFDTFAKSLPKILIDGIGNAANLLFNTGKDVIRGLFNGIKAIVQGLPAFLGPIKDAFIDGFNQAFEASSPAKAMKPVGQNISLGVMAGMTEEASGVVAAAEDIARQAANAQVAALNAPAGFGLGAGTAPGSGGTTVGAVHVNVSVPSGATREQAAEIGSLAGRAFVREIDTIVRAS